MAEYSLLNWTKNRSEGGLVNCELNKRDRDLHVLLCAYVPLYVMTSYSLVIYLPS